MKRPDHQAPLSRRTALAGILSVLAATPSFGRDRERERDTPRRNYFEEQEEKREREAERRRDRERSAREEEAERRDRYRRWFPRERLIDHDDDE